MDRFYFDNAATTWPKPEAVYSAVDEYQRSCGAAAGRGVYRSAQQAAELVSRARQCVADLLGATDARRIVFGGNGTDGLNLALHGFSWRPGDHVVTTVLEHNSVLRPLRFLERTRGVTVTRVPVGGEGRVDPREMGRAITPQTRLVVINHASNVTGVVQDLVAISGEARRAGVPLLIDAAQSLGRVPLSVTELGETLVAAPGHKGLLGPLGTGLLYIAPGLEARLTPVRQGGTGTFSESDEQPDTLPERYEAGNLNVPGLAGLAAGVTWLRGQGVERVAQQEQELTNRLLEGLQTVKGVTVYAAQGTGPRVGVVSLNMTGYDPQELAAALDVAAGIEARAGLHCAPLAHQALGTHLQGGTLRLSTGPFTTRADIDHVLDALASLSSP